MARQSEDSRDNQYEKLPGLLAFPKEPLMKGPRLTPSIESLIRAFDLFSLAKITFHLDVSGDRDGTTKFVSDPISIILKALREKAPFNHVELPGMATIGPLTRPLHSGKHL